MPDWADDPRCLVTYDTLRQRIRAGQDPEQAMTQPVKTDRTHCGRGHPYDENRKCMVCFNDRRRERRQAGGKW